MARRNFARPKPKRPASRGRVQARKLKWLRRDIGVCAVCYCLCLSETAYRKELKRLGIKDALPFLKETHSQATCNFLWSDKGVRVAIVTVNPSLKKKFGLDIHQLNALLVHEAVHIWQEHCTMIGEKFPSDESMAYGIQTIAQALMTSYAEQTAKK